MTGTITWHYSITAEWRGTQETSLNSLGAKRKLIAIPHFMGKSTKFTVLFFTCHCPSEEKIFLKLMLFHRSKIVTSFFCLFIKQLSYYLLNNYYFCFFLFFNLVILYWLHYNNKDYKVQRSFKKIKLLEERKKPAN